MLDPNTSKKHCISMKQLNPFKTIIVFAALALGCSDTDDTFRDGDRFTFLDESLNLLGVGTEPPADHQICCENGGCSPAVDGACPQGGLLHNCSDEEICNADGSACWYECAPAQPPPMSSEQPLDLSAGASLFDEPCEPSYCCEEGWTDCEPARNGVCPEVALQGWCEECYLGGDCNGQGQTPGGGSCCN